MTLKVADTGIGISQAFQKILFDPFTQENRSDTDAKRGSGLGLAIAKRMAGLMGGTIAVESEVGKGTVFTVEIECGSVPSEQVLPAAESRKDSFELKGIHGYQDVKTTQLFTVGDTVYAIFMENLYKLDESGAEAMEFYLKKESAVTGKPLSQLNMRENILICKIYRNGTLITPTGQTTLEAGDSVVLVALTKDKLEDIDDILKN